MSKPRVLVDCDGVLADFVSGFLNIVNAQFGTEYTPSDVTEFDIAKSLQWSAEQSDRAYSLIADCDRFAAKLAILPGAQSGIARLLEVAEVYVVTSPWWSHATWVRDRNNWPYEHFGIGAGRVVHTAAKHLIAGDVLVDDKTSTCEAWRKAWPQGIAVQFATLHNRRDAWDGESTSDWGRLIEIVTKTADSKDRWYGRNPAVRR